MCPPDFIPQPRAHVHDIVHFHPDTVCYTSNHFLPHIIILYEERWQCRAAGSSSVEGQPQLLCWRLFYTLFSRGTGTDQREPAPSTPPGSLPGTVPQLHTQLQGVLHPVLSPPVYLCGAADGQQQAAVWELYWAQTETPAQEQLGWWEQLVITPGTIGHRFHIPAMPEVLGRKMTTSNIFCFAFHVDKKVEKMYTSARKQMLISSLPPVIILHLKRFHQVGILYYLLTSIYFKCGIVCVYWRTPVTCVALLFFGCCWF